MVDGVSGSSSQFAAYAAPTASASAPPPPASASAPPPVPTGVPTGATVPGQTGGGIGDLQSVAPSSVARGQIVDIAA